MSPVTDPQENEAKAFVDGVEHPVDIVEAPPRSPSRSLPAYVSALLNFLSLPAVRAAIVTVTTSAVAFMVDRARHRKAERRKISYERNRRRRRPGSRTRES